MSPQRLKVSARHAAWVALAAATWACASARGAEDVGPRDASVITRSQITELQFTTVFDAVQTLHPAWLTAKGADSFSSVGQVQVYLDETHLGGPETLRTITPISVQSIRHVRALDATTRWGINHDKGAIVVSTRP
jgi:hypothetical protein